MQYPKMPDPHDMPGLLRGTLRASDVDELATALRGPWDFEIQQMGPKSGSQSWSCSYVTDGRGLIYEDQYELPVMLRGAPSKGLFAFGVADELARSGCWLGGKFPEIHLGYARAGRNLDIGIPGGGRTLAVFIPEEELEWRFEALAGATLDQAFRKDGVFLPLLPEACQTLVLGWRRILHVEDVDLVGKVAELLAKAWMHSYLSAPPHGPAAWSNFRRALERVNDSEQTPSLDELARSLGLTLRSLETAFVSCSGMPPCRYLRYVRLDRAHKRLKESHPEETTVTAIAMALGFTELGRFSGEYHKIFGELPSETLRSLKKRVGRLGPVNKLPTLHH